MAGKKNAIPDALDAAYANPEAYMAPPMGTGEGDMLANALRSLLTLPKRAIEGAAAYQPGSGTIPNETIGTALESALLPMGTGAIAGVPVRGAEAVLGSGPIRAYHGSPHDFERFDSSKIGTGEGAQAYGIGHYLAENPAVAKGYRDILGSDTLVTPKGTVFDPMTLEHLNIRSRAHSNGSNLDATIETAQKIAESNSPVADLAKRDLSKLLALKAEGGVKRNPGKMYEVDINADPSHFLDYDKPLSEQHPFVKETIEKHGLAPKEQDLGSFGGQPITGAPRWADTAEEAAKLRQAGIPGIKYLDAGSRNHRVQPFYEGKEAGAVRTFTNEAEATKWADYLRGQGLEPKIEHGATSNYVVFDDNLINIVKKYGLAGISMLPPSAAAFLSQRINPVDHNPFAKGGNPAMTPVDHDPFEEKT